MSEQEYCIKLSPCGNGGGAATLPDLSYEEQFAGYHNTDGKKVYFKTVNFGALPGDANGAMVYKDVPHNIQNLKEVLDLRFRYARPDNSFIVIGNEAAFWSLVSGKVGNATHISINETDIHVVVSGYPRTDMNGVAIIYYTCTDR